jgi:hypothetical protein
MWIADLMQIQQYYETLVTLGRSHTKGVGLKKETKEMNMDDKLSIQE